MTENPSYLTEQLITYIGNKRKLLPYIGQGVAQVQARLRKPKLELVDLFSGTGVVARYLKQFASVITVNDLELYSEVTNKCYLTNHSAARLVGLEDIVHEVHTRTLGHLTAGFITQHYAPKDEAHIQQGERVFYTRRNAMYLDTARQIIEEYTAEIKPYLLAPLIAQASVHANTSGVFKGFYKSKDGIGQYGGQGRNALSRIEADITLPMPIFSQFDCEVKVLRGDANVVAKTLRPCDLVYLDPPYNQHPYGSNYFMLNMLAVYQPPNDVSRVSGIPKDWNRSRYNEKAAAEDALFDVVAALPTSHILISYNSEGFISHERFLTRLKDHGTYSVVEVPYNTFRGSRNLSGRAKHVTEFLYLLEKNDDKA